MIRRFAAAWRFLTVFPFFVPPGEDEGDCLRRSMGMFPVVGLVLGAAAAVFACAARAIFPPAVSAALLVALFTLFSMGLHMDGLADCADALMSPGRDRDTALAVMKDSRIGAHGALAVVLILLTKFACLSSVVPDALPYAALCIPLAGRTTMLFPMILLPYARENGLGKIFQADRPAVVLVGAALFSSVAALAALGPVGTAYTIVFCAAVATWWIRALRRRLGGATGDAYGAACELGETAACLAAAAWQARPDFIVLIS